jgi:hypothetical protein
MTNGMQFCLILSPQNNRMTRATLFIVSLFCSVNLALAQDDVLKTLQEEGPSGQVYLELDSLLETNYHKMISKNMKSSGIPGYRIRIYSESGLGAKEEQQRVRASFLSLYPGLDAYNRYDEPFFKIYVGDCRTRSEALKLQDIINKDFPNSIIREDYINIKSTD